METWRIVSNSKKLDHLYLRVLFIWLLLVCDWLKGD